MEDRTVSQETGSFLSRESQRTLQVAQERDLIAKVEQQQQQY